MCPACWIPYVDGALECQHCGRRRSGPFTPSGLNAIVLRTALTLLALGICIVAGLCYYLNVKLVQSDAYKQALAIASSSPDVQNILGTNIHANKWAFGHLESFQGSEFAEWSVALSGARGTGHLYGISNQVNGAWDYSRLVFESDEGKKRLDLAPVHLLSLPRIPAKSVYLIPLGLTRGESLDWAPAYYKAKLGIDVTLLPSAPLDASLIDAKRNQLNSDKCIDEFLQRKYPQLARDPSVLMIVATSVDMYIPDLNWKYAENMRTQGRFAVVSSARLHPLALLEKLNPEWLNSRLQKLLTKNITLLYFDVPLSSDFTSLLSGGVLSGREIDYMGGSIIGAKREWDPFFESGGPAVSIYDVPGKNPLWNREWARTALPDTSAQVFSVSLDVGLLVQRRADFIFPDEPAMQFTRVYRNQDDRSRAFGIGGSHSFEMFLGGKMGVAVDLIMEDGHRFHFVHQSPRFGQDGDIYLPTCRSCGRFTEAVYAANSWEVRTTDGWTYVFPYRPDALPQYVTVLTGFFDPAHRKYEMERDSFGSLIEIKSPSGAWLHFENDSQHRIRRITASSGRSVQYQYDGSGSLTRATASDGSVDSYTYDDKGQMLTAAHADEKPVLNNDYFVDGYIKSQTMLDGQRFEYHYFRDRAGIHETYITDPNGLETYIQYEPGGYREWLPSSQSR